MIDTTLLVGRLLLVVLLFVFLFAVMRTGIGLVKGQNRSSDKWLITVARGPRELNGLRISVNGPVIIGRAPGADIVIAASYVSGRHARFTRQGDDLIIEDLGSTNGTMVNGVQILAPTMLESGDRVGFGDVILLVGLK